MDSEYYDVQELCLVHTQFDRWVRSKISQALEGTQLTMMEWLLLTSVDKHDQEGLTITAAADLLGVSLPQVTALAQQLRQKNLIEQRVEPEDRRSRRLCITPEGQKVCASGQRRIEEIIDDVSEAPQMRSYKHFLSLLSEQPSTVLE